MNDTKVPSVLVEGTVTTPVTVTVVRVFDDTESLGTILTASLNGMMCWAGWEKSKMAEMMKLKWLKKGLSRQVLHSSGGSEPNEEVRRLTRAWPANDLPVIV